MKLLLFLLSAQLKIVSLAPSVSEIIFRIGGENMLIGVTDYCSYPAEKCRKKEKVGGVIDPSIEKIIYLSPDLVIGFKGLTPPWVISSLKKANIKVVEVKTLSISDLKRDVRFISDLLNLTSNGENLIHEIESIQECSEGHNQKVVVFVNLLPPVVAGGKAFINEILKRTGLQNTFADIKADYFITSYEEIVIRNPDFGFLISNKKDKSFSFYHIEIYPIDENLYSVPSPKISVAVRKLCSKIRRWERKNP